MQIAMIAAGFTPDEADGLRRAMAAWKRKGNLGRYEQRLLQGMADRGYDPAFARGVVEQVKGFSSYGFPESHAASFAKLVYVSCWIKRHHPDVFLVALLNSQPLGFYTPNQLMQDARRHGVEVLPVDVSHSDWDAALAPPTQAAGPLRAVRLGLGLVDGLSAAAGQRIVAARSARAFDDVADLARRARLGRRELAQLAAADALASLSGHRRQQVWDAVALQAVPALLAEAPVHEAPLALPEAPEGEAVAWDYMSLGLTLRRHPLALLRPVLERRRLLSAADLQAAPDRRLVRCAGIVTLRQQPETASGVVFVSLEDETGVVQVIVWRRIRERFRQVLLHARLLAVYGHWQREGPVGNLIAGYLEDLTPLLGQLATGRSRDFH